MKLVTISLICSVICTMSCWVNSEPRWQDADMFRVCYVDTETCINVEAQDESPVTLMCDTSGFPGSVFSDNGSGNGVFTWTPTQMDKDTMRPLYIVVSDGTHSVTQEFCLWVGDDIRPVVDIYGTSWGDDGHDFTATDLMWSLHGISADENYSIAQTTWSNATTGIRGVAATTMPFWQVSGLLMGCTEGQNLLIFGAENENGVWGYNGIAVTFDESPPWVNIESPQDNDILTTPTVPLFGSAGDPHTDITGVSWSMSPSGNSGSARGLTSWEITNNVSIVSGTNTLTVCATNAVGLVGYDTVQFIYDSNPPVLVITNPTTADTYVIGNDQFTISGYASDADDAISRVIYKNTRNGVTDTATGRENWSFSAENLLLEEGTNVIQVTGYNTLNVPARDTLTIIYKDDTAPMIEITVPSNEVYLTVNQNFSINGIASDPESAIKEIRWSCIPGGREGAASGLENWVVFGGELGLIPGTNTFTATAENTFGDTANDSCVIIYEANLPYITITQPNGGEDTSVGHTNFVLEGIAGDVDTALTDVTWSNLTSGAGGHTDGIYSWSKHASELGIVQGANTIEVTARNAYGIIACDAITITIEDATPPIVIIEEPNDGNTFVTTNMQQSFSGRAQDNQSGIVKVNWRVVPAQTNGIAEGRDVWSINEGEVPLQEGTNVLTVTAYNSLGYSAEDSQIIIVDTSAPVIEIIQPTTAPVYSTDTIKFDFSGTIAGGALSGIEKVFWSNTTVGVTGQENCSNVWSISPYSLSLIRGTNDIVVYATSRVGLRGTDSIKIIVIDEGAPVIEIVSPDSGDFITESPVMVQGWASDNVSVYRVEVNGFNATGTENWSTHISLQAGVNTIIATAYDLPPSQYGQDSVTVFYGDAKKELLDVEIREPSQRGYWETSGSNVYLSGTASGMFGVDRVIWINQSIEECWGYADGQSLWTASAVPLVAGTNNILMLAYDQNDNWGRDAITIVSSDTGATNTSPVIFEKVRLVRNQKSDYSIFRRDRLTLMGTLSEDVFDSFDISDPENMDTVSVLLKAKSGSGQPYIREWRTTERAGEDYWNKNEWKETHRRFVKVKKSKGNILINPVKEGKMKVKLKWKKKKDYEAPEIEFKIKIKRQKIVGNQTDNTDALDMSEPIELWIGIGDAHTHGVLKFDERTGKAIQIL